jgi:hypothetical protein
MLNERQLSGSQTLPANDRDVGENGQALLATMIGKFSCEIGRSMN